MKKIFILLLAVVLLVGCTTQKSEKLPLANNLASEKNIEEVAEIFGENSLNADYLKVSTEDFSKIVGEKANLAKDWVHPNKLKPDVFECMDRWDKADYPDSNCRMTTFMLTEGLIKAKKTENKYKGTYLMFDEDAIKDKRYAPIKENIKLFTTLFGEKDVSDVKKYDLSKFWETVWDDYGISFENDNATLISVIILDPYDKVLFVGHTGVLIDCEEYYLFIEKIAFQQPYQATKVKNKADLLKILAKRPEYFGGDEEGPFVYENGELICENLKDYKK